MSSNFMALDRIGFGICSKSPHNPTYTPFSAVKAGFWRKHKPTISANPLKSYCPWIIKVGPDGAAGLRRWTLSRGIVAISCRSCAALSIMEKSAGSRMWHERALKNTTSFQPRTHPCSLMPQTTRVPVHRVDGRLRDSAQRPRHDESRAEEPRGEGDHGASHVHRVIRDAHLRVSYTTWSVTLIFAKLYSDSILG